MKNEFEDTSQWECPCSATPQGCAGPCTFSGADVLAYYEIDSLAIPKARACCGLLRCTVARPRRSQPLLVFGLQEFHAGLDSQLQPPAASGRPHSPLAHRASAWHLSGRCARCAPPACSGPTSSSSSGGRSSTASSSSARSSSRRRAASDELVCLGRCSRRWPPCGCEHAVPFLHRACCTATQVLGWGLVRAQEQGECWSSCCFGSRMACIVCVNFVPCQATARHFR